MISLKLLRAFWERYPDAKRTLRLWYKTAIHAQWRNLQDVHSDYPHADGVAGQRGETLTVFNICGNNYRLVARIRYDYRLVNVRGVFTHEEYSQGKWRK